MVENLVGLSQQREKIIARNFANGFIKPLYLEVYRLVLANEKKPKIARLAGNFVEVDPQDWTDEVTCTVELKLGYDEQAAEAQKYMGLHTSLSAVDGGSGRLYSEANKYALMATALDKTGIKQFAQFITDPKTLPPVQPDPMKAKQMELEERQIAVQENLAQTSAQKVSDHAQIEQMRMALEQMQEKMEQMIKSRKLDIEEFAATAKVALDTQELELTKKELELYPPQTQAVLKT
jgi:hypothetical protein